MADAVDRAEDGVATFDHPVDPHQRVLLAAIVVDKFSAHPCGDPAQVLDRTAAAADIENPARDAGLHRFVADLGTRTFRRVGRAHALLPPQVRELAGEFRDRALGGAGTFASGGQRPRAPIGIDAASGPWFAAFRRRGCVLVVVAIGVVARDASASRICARSRSTTIWR
jgi:hypothetical protein